MTSRGLFRVFTALVALIVMIVVIVTLATAFGDGKADAAVVSDDCKVSSTVLNRPDHGHGTVNGGYWANLHVTRTTEICRVPSVQTLTVVAPPEKWTYTATVHDEGTFVTIAGVTLSPNKAEALVGGVHGTVEGGFKVDFTANNEFLQYQDVYGDEVYSGLNSPTTTGQWVKGLWGGDDYVETKSIYEWGWMYETCSEMWVDDYTAANNDGQGENAGDITGKECPSPTPTETESPTPTASPSSTPSTAPPTGNPTTSPPTGPGTAPPSPSGPPASLPASSEPPVVGAVGGGDLPTTGSSLNVPLVAGGGLGLVVVGVLALWYALARRRRDRVSLVGPDDTQVIRL